ncbi:MAG TPA: DNA polymerase IV [Nitrososphaeraceae archaeon]
MLHQNRQWVGKIIFHIDLNSFYPSCEELRDQLLKGKPHAVIMTDKRTPNITKGVVASCSYEAKKLGVRSAMPLSKALKLCPNLILKPVDLTYYKQISERVIALLESYSDTLEQASIDEAYLDCTNKISTSGLTIEQYALVMKKAIKEQCDLLCSIGVASTKSAAKIASDYKKPDGLTIVSPDKLQIFLKPLEVERIPGVGTKTEEILKVEMGIESIGQLAICDVQKLMDRLGKKGIWLWQVATGQDHESVEPREDYLSFSNEYTLEKFTNNKQLILKGLTSLVNELYEKVNENGYEFRTVGIKLVNVDFTIVTKEKSYTSYQNKKESISSVVKYLLDKCSLIDESETNTSATLVRKIGLRVSNLIRVEKKNRLNRSRC